MNRSEALGDTEICRTCGKCCLTFTFYLVDVEGYYDRIRLLGHPDTFVERDGFYPDGLPRIKITIKRRCSMLLKNFDEKGGYRCKIYNQARPWMCEHYPFRGDTNECPGGAVTS
jgi:Fe-S-cluster containining protein